MGFLFFFSCVRTILLLLKILFLIEERIGSLLGFFLLKTTKKYVLIYALCTIYEVYVFLPQQFCCKGNKAIFNSAGLSMLIFPSMWVSCVKRFYKFSDGSL